MKNLKIGNGTFGVWWKFSNQIQNVEGWLLPGQDRWLLDIAHWLPNHANILEIGSFKGKGTICLALGCLNTRKHIYALDTFCGNDTDFVVESSFYKEWERNLSQLGGVSLDRYVTPCIGRSDAFYKYWTIPLHLLFIDGSHEYEDVLADFENFFPHIVPGGVVALHDVGHRAEKPGAFIGPHRVWHECISSQLYDTGFCSTLAYGRKK